MEKIVLIDGNNLMYRSYYATMYSKVSMKSNDNIPTNAVLAFINMLNKIIKEEQTNKIMIAFDKGKTFRHEQYSEYKAGRIKTPDDLKTQFVLIKKIIKLMNITCLEIDNYEADDIIGTFCKQIEKEENYKGLIISSDKDLLQLVSPKVDMKLLKQSSNVNVTSDNFKELFQVDPINIIDLKALQGDASDNIPGVPKVGEKTALKLLNEYKTIEDIYINIDNIKGSLQTNLINGKDSAFVSKELVTIYTDVEVGTTLEELVYNQEISDELIKVYKELNFTSLLKNVEIKVIEKQNFILVDDITKLSLEDEYSIYFELSDSNYHNSSIIGASIYGRKNAYYIPFEVLEKNITLLNKGRVYTYDYKRLLVALYNHNLELDNIVFDNLLALSLLEYNLKDDISYIASNMGYDVLENKLVKEEDFINNSITKARFIYESYNELIEGLKNTNQENLYYDIEFKLSKVLANMEYVGVYVDKSILDLIADKLNEELKKLEISIHSLAKEEFNISSPKQLGIILFEKLNLDYKGKKKGSYSTNVDVLEKLVNEHEIIPLILEYRTISKIISTYAVGLTNYIKEDSKIHTIYTQTITRTGRLSSIHPNLQNIPTKNIVGKTIRKAFVSNNGLLISADYSQIELRILAHLSNTSNIIEIFNNYQDIHSMTACSIFEVSEDELTQEMRRKAKVINFGILYGMSNFGLSEELKSSVIEAKGFMEAYYNKFSGVGDYMQSLIKEATDSGYSKTMFGRIRHINELTNSNYMIKEQGKRMALNTPIQGSSADIMKLAMINVYNKLNELNLKSKIVMQVHDELIIDAYLEEEEEVTRVLKEEMENVYKLRVPLIVDVNVASNWFDMK